MPTYEYECKNCGVFEVTHSMFSESVKKCDKCGNAVKKLISGGSGFILIGAGFHQNDYKKHMSSVLHRPKKKNAQEGMLEWSKDAKEQYGEVSKGNK